MCKKWQAVCCQWHLPIWVQRMSRVCRIDCANWDLTVLAPFTLLNCLLPVDLDSWQLTEWLLKLYSNESFKPTIVNIFVHWNLDHIVATMEFEKVFPELCTFGRYQKLIYFFVLLPAQLSFYCHVYSHLFLTYQPPHWCKFDHLLDKVFIVEQIASMPSNNHQPRGNWNNSLDSSAKDTLRLLESLRNNQVLQRFFFIPSLHVSSSHSGQNGMVNISKVMNNVKNSLVDYIDSLSSCSVYNASGTELSRFHNRFFQLFSMFTSQTSPSILGQLNTTFLVIPPIMTCDEWTFNKTWLGGDESIVTKVYLVNIVQLTLFYNTDYVVTANCFRFIWIAFVVY